MIRLANMGAPRPKVIDAPTRRVREFRHTPPSVVSQPDAGTAAESSRLDGPFLRFKIAASAIRRTSTGTPG
jgi:hypothetical protein